MHRPLDVCRHSSWRRTVGDASSWPAIVIGEQPREDRRPCRRARLRRRVDTRHPRPSRADAAGAGEPIAELVELWRQVARRKPATLTPEAAGGRLLRAAPISMGKKVDDGTSEACALARRGLAVPSRQAAPEVGPPWRRAPRER